MANSDCIVIQGSNMAEAHPVAFQYVTEAKRRGATVIHVDPRFSRTSALAHRHVGIRAGSDIVFLGAIINYILSNDLYFEEYVKAYTNASFLLREDFQDVDELDGVFSGYDPETASYDTTTWLYAESGEASDEGGGSKKERAAGDEHGSGGPTLPGAQRVPRDETLQDPRCVFQVLKRHYARYTPEVVEQSCGISREDLEYVARAMTDNSGRERTTSFCYAVGWTQHSVGAQYIRTACIIQLLLGNVGRPGGGVMALRGHASIQGSTDIPTLFNLLPGYLPMPKVGVHESLSDYLGTISSDDQKGFWSNAETYAVSLLKAWWGDSATADNDWRFDYLPRLTGDHGTYRTTMDMVDGKVEGYFLLGQNPAVASAHGRLQRDGLANLKWLVVRDLRLIESATFWRDSPEIESGERSPQTIGTEVFFFPAASHVEKAGTFTQTQRMLQWREQAVLPPGDAQSELDFFHEVGVRLRERLATSTEERDRPLLDLTWDYPVNEHGEVDAEAVLREINGRHLTGDKAGQPLNTYLEMKADGSTEGGCWIYTGVFADGVNQAARRKPRQEQDSTALEWGWVWPLNRRILYNRASADPQGRPWSERKKHIWWDEESGRWVGKDVPDFIPDRAPSYRPPEGASGPDALAGDDPFVMQADGKGWLFAPKGLLDGPLPSHYEPQEGRVGNPFYTQQASPTRKVYEREDNLTAPARGLPPEDDAAREHPEVYPYVFTTYRLTEHHTAGGMSRWLPYLAELQPEMFCEVSPELAAERGLEHLGWATLVSPRSAIEARVMVTHRMKPLTVQGRSFHQIGLPYHWATGGTGAIVSGDSVNDLMGVALDPNVLIQESKVGACDIRAGRRPRGPELLELVRSYRTRAGVTEETGNDLRSGADVDHKEQVDEMHAKEREDSGTDVKGASESGVDDKDGGR
ncbi:formate dehydrogenase [Arsenicicoccus sp. oral taxon 190]|nr:formate dehydrogenase [Arsenicicoccus sp. oral taxon 190]